MRKQFTIQGNIRYLEILPKILKQYNDTALTHQNDTSRSK